MAVAWQNGERLDEQVNVHSALVRGEGFVSRNQLFNTGVFVADLEGICRSDLIKRMVELAQVQAQGAERLWNNTAYGHIFDQPLLEIVAAKHAVFIDSRWNCRNPSYSMSECWIIHAKGCSRSTWNATQAAHVHKSHVHPSTFMRDSCVRKMVQSFHSDDSPIKRWLYDCWHFKLDTCTNGDPKKFCAFQGFPCLWGNMPPHKLQFIASLARALDVTHIIH